MTNRIRRPRAEYEALYDRKLAERLTYDELAAETGVPASTLSLWLRRIAKERTTPAAFSRIEVADADATAVEIVVPNGLRVAVRPGFDSATLKLALAVASRC